MRQTRALKQVLERSLSGLDDAYSASEFERRQSLEDREFYLVAGKQWAGSLGDQFENKPRFEFNKVHLSVIRLFNEYRNNPIAVDFVAKDDAQNDELSDACDMMLRADEQDSNAEEAYDNAFEEATAGGYGGYRLCAKYEDEGDEENERQRIHIMPMRGLQIITQTGSQRTDVLMPIHLDAALVAVNPQTQVVQMTRSKARRRDRAQSAIR